MIAAQKACVDNWATRLVMMNIGAGYRRKEKIERVQIRSSKQSSEIKNRIDVV